MNESAWRDYLLIWLSFIIACILQITPLPNELIDFRPSWLMLVCFYWAMALPQRVSVGTALILGVLWDIMLGSTLGIRGFMMSIVIYLVALNFQMLRNMSLWQQAAVLTLLTLVGKLIIYMFEYSISPVKFEPSMFLGGIFNFILWPWLFLLLRRFRRQLAIG